MTTKKLFLSPLTGKLYIANVNVKGIITKKEEIDMRDLWDCVAMHVKRTSPKSNMVTITADGEPIIDIKTYPENF
jgi:hypothetical protein